MRSSKDGARAGSIRGNVTDGVENLTTVECWRLIGTETLGRIAITARDGAPDVSPLNYSVHDGSIYFRSAPGSKLAALAVHPVAAWEVDGDEAGLRWSVVARGVVRRLNTDEEIHRSGVKHILSSSPTAKYNYFCFEPSSVSGRRFIDRSSAVPSLHPEVIARPPIGRQEPTRGVDDTVLRSHRVSPGSLRPVRIAHFPPR